MPDPQKTFILATGMPPIEKKSVLPVFMPFAGCPVRCVFCAQNIQTGRATSASESALLEKVWQELKSTLESRAKAQCAGSASAVELAFYGGTFTALPLHWQEHFLRLGQHFAAHGVVSRMRCSTRPDALSPGLLDTLRGLGLAHIELGIQSFYNPALEQSRRAYTADQCHAACVMIQTAGLDLGVQLMPGMPGLDPQNFLRDVQLMLTHQPATIRLYPCLVIKGTGLAQWWQDGLYQPWDRERTLVALASAVQAIWAGTGRIIRIGLAHSPELDASVLAGVHLPDLGSRVQARALLAVVRDALGQHQLCRLALPRRFQGFFWGHQKELRAAWQTLGVTSETLTWWDSAHAELECAERN